jgi:hypothetical protein
MMRTLGVKPVAGGGEGGGGEGGGGDGGGGDGGGGGGEGGGECWARCEGSRRQQQQRQ